MLNRLQQSEKHAIFFMKCSCSFSPMFYCKRGFFLCAKSRVWARSAQITGLELFATNVSKVNAPKLCVFKALVKDNDEF